MPVPKISPVGELTGLQHQLQVDQSRLRDDQKKLRDHQEAAKRVISADQARIQADQLAISMATPTAAQVKAVERPPEVPQEQVPPPAAKGGSGTGAAGGTDVYL